MAFVNIVVSVGDTSLSTPTSCSYIIYNHLNILVLEWPNGKTVGSASPFSFPGSHIMLLCLVLWRVITMVKVLLFVVMRHTGMNR